MDAKIFIDGRNYAVRDLERRDLKDLNGLLNDVDCLRFCLGGYFLKTTEKTVQRMFLEALGQQKQIDRASFDLAIEPNQRGEGLFGLISVGRMIGSEYVKLMLLTKGDYLESYPVSDAVLGVINHWVSNFRTNGFHTHVPQTIPSFPLRHLFEDLGFENIANTNLRAYYSLAI